MELRDRVAEAVTFIEGACRTRPEIAIILGTGLGSLAGEIEREKSFPYDDIPHFARSTAIGHKGELVLGTLAGRPVAAMEGRLHAYEGYSMDQITFPVRVLRALGAKILIVSNACGGMNPSYQKGDLMFIDDHINLMGVNPLIGPNDEQLGPRFPDMCRPYDSDLMTLAENTAKKENIRTHRGVYVAVLGPNLETRAEYRFLRTIGADVVGMSTVPEVLVAVHAGFRILGVSIITDLCDPDNLEPANIREILAVAGEAEPKMSRVLREVISTAK